MSSYAERRLEVRHLLSYLLLGSFAVSSGAALTWALMVSIKTDREFIGSSPWSLPGALRLGNYARAWELGNIGTYFFNSVIVSITATLLGVVASCLAAYALARIPFRLSGLVQMTFLTGLMVPWMVTFIPLYFLLLELRLLNTRTGLVLVYATYNIPFSVFVLVGFMKTLPTELEEAAAVDGASPLQAFLKVILPLTGPGIATVLVLNFLTNWNEFFYALIFLTDESRFTLPLGLVNLASISEYGAGRVLLFAGMVMAMLPVIVVFALLQERVTEGLTTGALKG